jgi:predicted transcriptional regulator
MKKLVMGISLIPDLLAKLSRLAAQQGRSIEALVVDAVERLVSDDEWFRREVAKGLAAADRGELIDHDEVSKLIKKRYPG